jgi:hypothetical protein
LAQSPQSALFLALQLAPLFLPRASKQALLDLTATALAVKSQPKPSP